MMQLKKHNIYEHLYKLTKWCVEEFFLGKCNQSISYNEPIYKFITLLIFFIYIR